ncbi:uncharacterized protein LOC123714842 [Pieris brassicae]|uniref:uncharacterized protein LOC123714842 n=1 Tax=Pieris brassicae TaxID=7116 RepID=UPI001E661156|nr:uncharacterized protein LOC123714842 [Pieris brassicae]
MSTSDQITCPGVCETTVKNEENPIVVHDEVSEKKEEKPKRKVSFPHDEELVTQYFEPANPWHDVPTTTRAQLAGEYLEACRSHNTPPIDSVLQQIRELSENTIGGCIRAARLTLAECSLLGPSPVDALESLLSKVQFRRLEIDHVEIDDEGAEAIFDMIEYYESASAVCISGPRQFGIRGWQAASRMIKKSAELTELEISESPLEAAHAPVLARSLKPLACRVRSLCLQQASLAGESLLCLVIALKSNNSVRELRLGDNGLTQYDAVQLGSLLRYNTRLQLLDLSNNQIQDAGVCDIANALVEQSAHTPPSAPTSPLSPHHCPLSGYEYRGLAFLVLWNNQLTRNCAQHLARVLNTSKSLCVLNVGRNALGSEGVKTLTMSGGGALVSLGLQAARLSLDAAKCIAELIQSNSKLQRLDLRDNRLGVAGLQAICNAVKDNQTLTQIDLDDPPETPNPAVNVQTCTEAATMMRLTKEIRAICQRNEPSGKPVRKISLTCHTAHAHTTALLAKPSTVEERRVRLRSPAPSPAPSPSPSPSPAGSPIPPGHANSRFYVTRVTPERDSSTDSSSPSTPTKPSYCPTPSRFKVVQVAEPPQIQIHPAQPRRPSSRFSVTRNYDAMYNPSPAPSPSPPPATESVPAKSEIKAINPDTALTFDKLATVKKETKNKSDQDSVKTDIAAEKLSETRHIEWKTVKDAKGDETDGICDKRGKSGKENKMCSVSSDKQCVKSKEHGAESDFVIDRVKAPISMQLIAEPSYKKDNISSEIVIQTEDIEKEKCQCDTKRLLQDKFARIENIEPKIEGGDKKSKEIIKKDSEKEVKADNKNDKRIESVVTEIVSEIEPLKFTIKQDSVIHGPQMAKETQSRCLLSSGDKTETEAQTPEIVKVAFTNIIDNVAWPPLRTKSDKGNQDSTDLKVTTQSDSVKNVKISDTVKLGDILTDSCKDKVEELSQETVSVDKTIKTETKLVKNSVEVTESEKVDVDVTVVVKKESNTEKTKVHSDQIVNIDNKVKGDIAIKQIEAITADLGSLIQEMHDLTTKTKKNDLVIDNVVPVRDNVVLKKNKSESSLDSPDLEVSRLMRKQVSAFCDSSSSLEISGSSVESLNIDRMKPVIIETIEAKREQFSNESSMESTSEVTPVNLNVSISSNESVSPIIFGTSKKIHDSLSSLEASVSSIESAKEKMMVTSADSGIEHSLNPSDVREDNSSNEGTLTNSSSLKDTDKSSQETLTSPKRTSSLLDVPALKSKGLERMRKISWVAPSPSFHIPRPEPEKVENKFPSNLEKLLSLFQHPSSLFSRATTEDDKKSTSSTPPRKDSSLTSSFWSWASSSDKSDKDDKDADSLSEATDSTLSERVQVSFVDESFSKKFDKTPSTDTENTLSEFQSFQAGDTVTDITTDEKLVQILDVSKDAASIDMPACKTDLIVPNDYEIDEKCEKTEKLVKLEEKIDVRPRTFASVLKSTGSENSLDKQSPEAGQPVDKFPTKVIRGIKENVSPENTITSMSTKALVYELSERPIKNSPIVSTIWEIQTPVSEKSEVKFEDHKAQSDLAPIANIDETCDVAADESIQFAYIDDVKVDEDNKFIKELGSVDVAKDALSYLESKDTIRKPESSLAQELKDAERKELVDLSPELVLDEALDKPDYAIDVKGRKSSPVIPERAKLKKSNSLEDLTKRPEKESPKLKSIAFKVPESTTPRDIPQRRTKLRNRSGSSPKSLPESLNKPCPLAKMDSILSKKKKKVSSLGKMARDSLLALNMSEEEIAEFRRSYKLTSVESLRSLESVSEDANSQSGTSIDSRCRACLRTSQESLMSLDSITEDCRCQEFCERRTHR